MHFTLALFLNSAFQVQWKRVYFCRMNTKAWKRIVLSVYIFVIWIWFGVTVRSKSNSMSLESSQLHPSNVNFFYYAILKIAESTTTTWTLSTEHKLECYYYCWAKVKGNKVFDFTHWVRIACCKCISINEVAAAASIYMQNWIVLFYSLIFFSIRFNLVMAIVFAARVYWKYSKRHDNNFGTQEIFCS